MASHGTVAAVSINRGQAKWLSEGSNTKLV